MNIFDEELVRNSSWYEGILWLLLLLILSVVSAFYLIQTLRSRKLYPISVLSPKLTIVQGICLYVFLMDCSLIVWFWRMDIINKTDDGSGQNVFFLVIDSFAFIYMRGLFFVITILKSLRYALASSTIEISGVQLLIFRSENFMIICGSFITLIIYAGFSFSYAAYRNQIGRILLLVEETNVYRTTIHGIEISVIVITIMLLQKSILQIPLFRAHVLYPLLFYVAWNYVNLLASKLLTGREAEGLTYGVFTIWVSCCTRAVVMFYVYIIQPLQNREVYRPFEPVEMVMEFDHFFNYELNYMSFYNYTMYLDKKRNVRATSDSDLSLNLLAIMVTFEKTYTTWLNLKRGIENRQISASIDEEIYKITQQLPNELHIQDFTPQQTHEQIYLKLTIVIREVFDSYLQTVSGVALYKYHERFNVINQNLHVLNMQNQFFIPVRL